GVNGGHAAREGRLEAFHVLGQTEIRDLDVVVDQEQVLRFDVQVLDLIVVVHQIERFGGFAEITQQFPARYAAQAIPLALAEAIEQVAVGQLHDNEQLPVHNLELFQIEDEGMAN